MLVFLLALHAILGVAVLVAARRLGRWGLVIGGLAPGLTMGWALTSASRVFDGDAVGDRATWVPALGLSVDLRFDAFAFLMTVLVSGVGTLVFGYGWWYFGASEKVGRTAGLLTLFAGAMFGVVVADNLLMLYVCWELTSITSYLLIGIDDTEPEARSAALHALLVTGMGGLAMLGGFVAIGQEAGTYRIAEILADPPTSSLTAVALVFVLLGAFTKSAQYPFHSWLPAAMVAPTPVSAYLHSAAMVKAGVYLIARLGPAFAAVGVWRPLVVTVGLTTMVAGGLRALRPFDLKQLLAFGTISQLGFMTVLLGIGRPQATAAGCALLLTHALFKAALFMTVGIVDHEAHTRDVRELPHLGSGWGLTRAVAFVSAASMAAIPPLGGFIAKEEAYAALVHGGDWERLVLVGIVAGSVLTVAYSLRFCVALWRPNLVSGVAWERQVVGQRPSRGLVIPGAVLAVTSMVFGIAPMLWSGLVDSAAGALDSEAGTHLELWHGFTAALGLSVVTLVLGGVVFAARRWVAMFQGRLAPAVNGADVYDALVRGMQQMATMVTSIVQSGSMPIYIAVTLATAAVVPGVALMSGEWFAGWPALIGRPVHVPIAGTLMIAALAATLAARRFGAVLLLGVVGYAMVMFFVVQGAPDLALTQFAVETLSVVVFLLVLRRLPDRFERRAPAVGRLYRLTASAAVGVFVVLMAVATSGSRTEPAVSRAMSDRALADGDGKNVVNVILVDIRGMDTLGEISVLVAAAVGIVALARVGESPRHRPRRRTSNSNGGP